MGYFNSVYTSPLTLGRQCAERQVRVALCKAHLTATDLKRNGRGGCRYELQSTQSGTPGKAHMMLMSRPCNLPSLDVEMEREMLRRKLDSKHHKAEEQRALEIEKKLRTVRRTAKRHHEVIGHFKN